jgi:hypothetical protein
MFTATSKKCTFSTRYKTLYANRCKTALTSFALLQRHTIRIGADGECQAQPEDTAKKHKGLAPCGLSWLVCLRHVLLQTGRRVALKAACFPFSKVLELAGTEEKKSAGKIGQL